MTKVENVEQMLGDVDLFAALSNRQKRKLVGLGRMTEHPAGHTVASEGSGALAFHLITSGEASVQHGGEEVRRMEAGDYFGEISMIDGKPRSASVVATQPVTTLAIHRSDFLELLDSESTVARTVLEGLCARLRAVEQRQ